MQRIPESAVPAKHRIVIFASDPVAAGGLSALLGCHPRLELLPRGQEGQADVVVVSTDLVAIELVNSLREIAARTRGRVVLILRDTQLVDLFNAAERGVAAVLSRSEATAERIVAAVLAVGRGEAQLSPALQARLLEQIRYVQREVLRPNQLNHHGLTDREIEVVRLVASGMGLRRIGDTLSCSERTIKNILHSAATRLGVGSRIEVVAYASRVGAI